MTSTGKLHEVEYKITRKKYGIFYCWTIGTVQTLKAN